MTYTTEHLAALEASLFREKARLDAATNRQEIALRAVWVSQVEKEIAGEITFLATKGIIVFPLSDEITCMSDDELLAELAESGL